MKKLVLTVLALAAFTFANAQDGGFAKGDIFISGAVGYSSETTGDIKDNTFVLSPRAAYFVTDNIAAGLRIGYESISEEFPGGEFDETILTAGVFGRYYFTPGNKFSVFGELGLNYLSQKEDNGATDLDTTGFGLGVGPGVSYFISDSFALEAFWGAISYQTTEPDVDNSESTDEFNFGVNLEDITLGLVYKF
ncbi:porin family protein [Aquimarina sp. MMG016]|uniref:porin family protein n=1 Tax=Aquimarina sp. MMG016 TaxID=2822690 RepID=UPI001B3A789E|nr:porin family protein [Aquimarina sp. MMG016]MBQ4819359.1 porin family protein [Aquimarina sp. MMG016]